MNDLLLPGGILVSNFKRDLIRARKRARTDLMLLNPSQHSHKPVSVLHHSSTKSHTKGSGQQSPSGASMSGSQQSSPIVPFTNTENEVEKPHNGPSAILVLKSNWYDVDGVSEIMVP